MAYGDDGGADEVGDDLTITTAAFPSDDNDRSGGSARLDSLQRQRSTGSSG